MIKWKLIYQCILIPIPLSELHARYHVHRLGVVDWRVLSDTLSQYRGPFKGGGCEWFQVC